jgi:aspartyl/asparaginyl beta-hydroxylase (cupin superfamily)
VSWSPPRSDVYRVFFDSEAKKVCVELNGKRWDEIHSKLEDEVLFCDILRTLIWVLICEVELFEARESEKAADTVTAEVTEIIIP